MTRKNIAYFILVLIIVISTATVIYFKCNSQPPTALSNGKIENVLFIGNSLTYTNNLPKVLSDIAQSMGDIVDYDMYAPAAILWHKTQRIRALWTRSNQNLGIS